jgi:hypothetical protein
VFNTSPIRNLTSLAPLLFNILFLLRGPFAEDNWIKLGFFVTFGEPRLAFCLRMGSSKREQALSVSGGCRWNNEHWCRMPEKWFWIS